jgi:hypothetical protein
MKNKILHPLLSTLGLLFLTINAYSQIINYAPVQELSRIKDASINEISGVASSYITPNAFWVHNDSGDSPRIFLVDKNGNTLTRGTISNASANDWEDIASFVWNGKSYLIIADIGDNAESRSQYSLYIIEEPTYNPSGSNPSSYAIKRRINFTYDTGPQNCESMAVDVQSGKIILVSKTSYEGSKKIRYVHELPLSVSSGTVSLIANKIQQFGTIAEATTGMDISKDGKYAIIHTVLDGNYEFTRNSGETWADAFAKTPRRIGVPEERGFEAICYGTNGVDLYLMKEGINSPILFYRGTINTSSVSLSPASATINSGSTQQLTVTVNPSNATNKNVSYRSSNTAVATVNSAGLVTAVATGTATITVTTQDGAKTDSSLITVVMPVSGVAVSPATASLTIGATQQLTATVSPSNASNKVVSYSSNNTAVATVNNSGLVTALTAGTATITVTTQDGAKTASSVITVTAPNTASSIQILQAEDAAISGAVIATNQTDYLGTGFVDFVNPTGDYIQWTVNVPIAGTYELSFRYSLLSGSRPLELKVNNTLRVASLDFPFTGSWSTWEYVSTSQALNAGNNTIRLTTNGSNGGNIDQLKLSPYVDTCDAISGWSSASANTLTYVTSDKKQGAGCVQMIGSATEEFRKVFSPSLNSGTTIANGVVSFWYYISDVTKTGTVRVELGSGGAPDVNELSWGLTGLVNGWNKIDLNFSTATVLGSPNLSALNWFRVFSTKTASITTRIDGILITKTSGASGQKTKKSVTIEKLNATEEVEKSVSVYPNPFRNGTLSINLKGYENNEEVQIKITNVLGQVIHDEKVTKPTQVELNISNKLTDSVYFISIETGISKTTKKLLVK